MAATNFASDSSAHADSDESRRYHRLQRRLGVANVVVGFLFLALLLATGWSGAIRDVACTVAADHYVVALFLYTFVLLACSQLLGLGFDYYGFLLEHRFHLSHQRLRAWLWDQSKAFLVGLVISEVLVQSLYSLIRHQPQWWWVTAWVLFNVFSVAMVHVAPVLLFPLFFRFRRLADEELTARLTRLSQKAGARVRGVYEWTLSEKTRKANAALMGLGHTRRIVVSDTLLANCTHDEIEAVLAHELGHHVHRHIVRLIALQTLLSFVGFWCLKLAVRWADFGWHRYPQFDFANLPLIVLVGTALSVLLVPFTNAVSRHHERQADRYAWKTLGSTAAFCSAMEKLAGLNLAEREPSRLVELLFHSHPSTARRIRAAQAWSHEK